MSDDPPRVAMLTDSLSSAAGGLFYATRDICSTFAARGLTPMVFGMRDAMFATDRAQWAGSELHVFDSKAPAAFKANAALPRALGRANLDVLHLHGIWNFASLAALLWRRSTGRPLVISPHGMLDPGALAFSPRKKAVVAAVYERRNLARASVIHALNLSEAESVRAYGLETTIAIIPNGVRLPDPGVLSARDWSAERRRTLLFLARIHPKKGVQELIAAWRLLLDGAPAIGTQWRLDLAGWDDGGLLDEARRQVATLGLQEHVTLPGALFGDAKHDAFRTAHAFILPSRSEGLPVSILEAWSYGLPVFMTDACNLPGGFAAGAAIRIETDSAALAAVLAEHLARDGETLRAIGARGRDLVARDFSLDRVCDDYLALYGWLHRGGDAPAFLHFAKGRQR